METTQTQTDPTPTQTADPATTLTTDPVAPVATTAGDPVVDAPPVAPTADPVAEPQQQQTTEPPPTSTEPEPATEPEPGVRVVPAPSEYELPEGIPDQVRIFAHETGFTQEQLVDTLNQFGGYMQGMRNAEQTSLRGLGEAHLKNWGPDANTKLALAKQALKQNDPEGALSEALESSGYGNHPAVLDFLHSIGKSMQEGGFLKSTVPRPPGQKTAAQAMYGDGITKKQ